MPICGGLGCAKPATPEVQDMCNRVKPEVEEKHGKCYPTFEAVEYKAQVVAGTNFFIKVHVGNGEYVHVAINKALPHADEKLSLCATQIGKTKTDEIEYCK